MKEFVTQEMIFMLMGVWVVCFYLYLKREIKKPLPPAIKPEKFEKNRLIDTELNLRYIKIFDRIIIKKYLFLFKRYGSLSDETRKAARNDFIVLIEAEFNVDEKILLNDRYGSFSAFKYNLLEFFENRLTKLEIFLMFNSYTFSKEKSTFTTEFKDAPIYEMILSADKNEIIKLMEAFQN